MELSIWSHASIFHVDYSTTVPSSIGVPEWNENFTCCSKMLRSAKLKEKYEDRFQLKNSSGRSNDYVQWIVLPTSYNSKENRLLLLPCHSCSKVSTTVNFAITRQMINAPRTQRNEQRKPGCSSPCLPRLLSTDRMPDRLPLIFLRRIISREWLHYRGWSSKVRVVLVSL